jgi:hypothetical protein
MPKYLTLQTLLVMVTRRAVVNRREEKVAKAIIGIAMIEIIRKYGMIDIADDVILQDLTIAMMFGRKRKSIDVVKS